MEGEVPRVEMDLDKEGSAVLPPISETQLVAISVVLLLCGTGIGFILGSLWMEQRLKRQQADRVKELTKSQERSSSQIGLSL